jgi:hypothetical protein
MIGGKSAHKEPRNDPVPSQVSHPPLPAQSVQATRNRAPPDTAAKIIKPMITKIAQSRVIFCPFVIKASKICSIEVNKYFIIKVKKMQAFLSNLSKKTRNLPFIRQFKQKRTKTFGNLSCKKMKKALAE